MNVLDTSIANVSIPGDLRRPRRVAGPGHLGDHLVRRRQRDFAAADRLAHAALRAGGLFMLSIIAVRRSPRSCAALAPDARRADLVPRPAGRGGGADDSAVAGAAAVELSEAAKPARRSRCGRSRPWWRRWSGRCSAAGSPTTSPGRGSSTSTCRSASSPALVDVDDLQQARDADRKLPIDTVGLGLLVLWVGSLQIMLDKGKDLDWFNSAPDRRAGRASPWSALCSS